MNQQIFIRLETRNTTIRCRIITTLDHFSFSYISSEKNTKFDATNFDGTSIYE